MVSRIVSVLKLSFARISNDWSVDDRGFARSSAVVSLFLQYSNETVTLDDQERGDDFREQKWLRSEFPP